VVAARGLMEQAWAPPRDVACLVGWMAMVGAPPG
jgi:hypothetical protein